MPGIAKFPGNRAGNREKAASGCGGQDHAGGETASLAAGELQPSAMQLRESLDQGQAKAGALV
jgi:hypothetical protein